MRWIMLFGLLVGCTKDDETATGEPGDNITDPDGDADADDTGAPVPELPPLMNGLFSSGFAVGPVAGLIVSLQLEFEMSMDESGARTIDNIILRAANDEGEVSEDLAVAGGIPVGEDGAISVDWPLFTLPAVFSPTSGDVDIKSVMVGTVRNEDFACGEVTGDIVSFEMDLAGSTFGTTPWEDRILGTPSSCTNEQLEEIPRITDCPTMSAGRSSDFTSGGVDREYELHIPDDYDGSAATPLAFVLHGIGSSIDGILGSENLLEEANRTGHIVLAPQATERGGTAAWDPVGPPGFNLDVALFDDLLTCMSEQYNIDSTRVHVTGMSLGGLFTGTLISSRSEVIASAAPFSGGLFRPKSEGWQPIPTLVSWGGPEDTYYGQDFDSLAYSMIDQLSGDGHFVVSCDHGGGHTVRAELWPYAFRFFQDHPQGVEPAPYLDTGLPSEFPEYCSIVE